jgi:hypothetical protein
VLRAPIWRASDDAWPFLTSTRSPCICSTCALIRPAVCISWSRRAKLDRYETDFVGFKRAYLSIWEKSGLFRYPWQLHRTLAEPYECSWSEYQLHHDCYFRPDSSTSGAGRDREAGSQHCEFQTIDEHQKITGPSKTGADNLKCGDQDQSIQPHVIASLAKLARKLQTHVKLRQILRRIKNRIW